MMKKFINVFLLGLLLISCTSKTTGLIVSSKTDIELGKPNQLKITRIQQGHTQTNDSNEEVLNYYFFLIEEEKDIPLNIAENKKNVKCEQNTINVQNGSELSNVFNKDILLERENNDVFIYIDCLHDVYRFTYENEKDIKIKLIVEDKKYIKARDSIVFSLKK